MNNVYRLYNKNGEHVLSILQCFDSDQNDVLDIANPDGKVFICGSNFHSSVNEAINTLKEFFICEQLSDNTTKS